jgi:hypothetical protein
VEALSLMVSESAATNRDCVRGRISLKVSESATTQFSLAILQSTGIFTTTNPCVSYRGRLVDYFSVVSYTVFGDDYRVNRDCARRRIKASAGEAVSVKISDA